MNKKNLRYKKYFTKLNQTLTKFNNHFLYHIPDLYKKDLRKDKISITKIKFSFFKSLLRKSYLYDDIKNIEKAKICFISHYVGNKIKDKNYDFYYGNLFKKIKIKIPYYVILINHTNENLNEIKQKFNNSKIPRVYINNDFNILSDSFNVLKITKEYLNFKILNFFNHKQFKISNKLNLEFDYKYFLSSRYTYKITNSIIRILDKSKNLDNLVTTFEGHAFEKIIFNYCKKKKIKSIGYFFSVIREYKNSIYYIFNKKYQPDTVLTAGFVSKEDLKLNSPLKNIEILGSNKNLSKINKLNILKNKEVITVLVCPEGLFTETIKMLKLINSNLLYKKNIKFIFRTHPLIYVLRDFSKNIINKNIIFSKEKNIANDFKKSDIILYNGSSTCIQATMSGLVPVTFNDNVKSFSLDPLYKINDFIIKNPNTLLHMINIIDKNKFTLKFKKKLNKIQKYCHLYFQKFNQKILTKSIIYNENK
tara:strand:+ start:86 stop:1516 length:1431 start_codon:yes stop_codon:yes gene_type:complete